MYENLYITKIKMELKTTTCLLLSLHIFFLPERRHTMSVESFLLFLAGLLFTALILVTNLLAKGSHYGKLLTWVLLWVMIALNLVFLLYVVLQNLGLM